MITNDTCCCPRWSQLQLSWWRRPLRRRRCSGGRGIRLRPGLHIRRRNPGPQTGLYTGQCAPSMTVHDGGMMHTSSFCTGLWNRPPAIALRHRILRRHPLAVALDRRVATSRQHQPQTMEPHLRRRHADVALPPDGHVADEPIYRADGSSGAPRKRPGLARRRARAAMAACECGRMTAPARCARHDVHQLLLGDALIPRGWRVAGVERPMSEAPHAPLRLQRRAAVAEYARPLRAARRRRGRQAKRRRGQLLPGPRAPDGSRLAPDRRRAASRGRLAPVQAAVVEPMLAWYPDAGPAPSF